MSESDEDDYHAEQRLLMPGMASAAGTSSAAASDGMEDIPLVDLAEQTRTRALGTGLLQAGIISTKSKDQQHEETKTYADKSANNGEAICTESIENSEYAYSDDESHYSDDDSEADGDTAVIPEAGGAVWRKCLFKAVKKKDLETATALIKQVEHGRTEEILANAVGSNSNTVFHVAAKAKRNEAVLTVLLDWTSQVGKILSKKNNGEKTPFHYACLHQNGSTVVQLGEAALKDDPDFLEKVVDRQGNTAFHYASKNHQDSSALLNLLERSNSKAESLLKKNKKEKTPFQYACKHQNASTIVQLTNEALKHDPDCLEKIVDVYGDTVFHYAARNRRYESALFNLFDRSQSSARRLLIKNKPDETPFHYTCAFQNAPTIVQLADEALKDDPEFLDKIVNANGDTVFHYAARNGRDESALLCLLDRSKSRAKCLLTKNNHQEALLHCACQHQSASTIVQLAEEAQEEASNCLETLVDGNGDTVFHYAARNRRDESALIHLLDTTNSKAESLLLKNYKKKTPILNACRFRHSLTVLQLVDKALKEDSDFLEKKIDASGDTVLHHAARKQTDESTLFNLLERSNSKAKSLLLKNNVDETPFDLAIESQSAIAIGRLVDEAVKDDPEFLEKVINSNGDTVFHYAARKRRDESALLNLLDKSTSKAKSLLVKNKEEKTPLHYACEFQNASTIIGLVEEARSYDPEFYERTNFGERDSGFHRESGSKCTLLHSLFANSSLSVWDSGPTFLRIIKTLTSRPRSMKAENNLYENFLHASKLRPEMLNYVLLSSASVDWLGTRIKEVLYNSQGFHAVHAFSRRYDLGNIISPLARVSGLSQEELMRLPVLSGPFAGATCLHLACEAGHKENIRFLLSKGLPLSQETVAGRSCMDFGFDKGRFRVIENIAKKFNVTKVDLLGLIDAPKNGLKLPDLESARRELALIADPAVIAEVEKSSAEKETSNRAQDKQAKTRSLTKKAEEEKSNKSDANIEILYKAFMQDSPKILRCALRIKPLSTSAEQDFCRFVLEKEAEAQNKMPTSDPCRQKLSIFKMPLTEDGDFSGYLSEFYTLQRATEQEKVNILPDLVLIRQFDIIPYALTAISLLKLKVGSQRGKYEILMKIKLRLIVIVGEYLDDLYLNATDAEKELLYDYIRGNFSSQSRPVSETSQTGSGRIMPQSAAFASKELRSTLFGPKFLNWTSSCEQKLRALTVNELIEEADCDELFATECMHNMVEEDWSSAEPDAVFKNLSTTSQAKFYSYVLFFVMFLFVFAYQIVSFTCSTSTKKMSPSDWTLLVLLSFYALSFTFQEIDDFYRRRRKTRVSEWGTSCWIPLYFKDWLNVFDIAAILTMWMGVVLNLIAFSGDSTRRDMCHASQMMLSTSFLLWGFRSVAFLNYFHNIGPVVSMLGSLIVSDLLQFLLIIFIIFYSFGVFFFNLLFPAIDTRSANNSFLDVAAQVLTVPLYMMFGIFEKFDFQPANSSDLGSNNIQVGEFANPTGHWWFYNVLIFIFLILVNIVMVNLLIALFSLRVSRMAEKAKVIWRRKYYNMQQEYRHISFLPPPFSFFYYPIKWCRKCSRQNLGNKTAQENEKLVPWWSVRGPVKKIPKKYLKFLKFQAFRLRATRPKLLQAVPQHWGDVQELLGHAQKLVEMQGESEGALERQAQLLQLMQERSEDRFQCLSEQLQQRLAATETQLSELQKCLQKLEERQTEQLNGISQLVQILTNQRMSQPENQQELSKVTEQ